jgi:hypothetical protein
MNIRVLSGVSPLWNVPGEGVGGAAAAAPSPGAAAAAPVVAPSGQPATSPAGVVAPGAPAAAPAAADYWPEGLDPALKGADSKTTLDNMAKSFKGYRDKIASRNVPETAEGYADISKLGDQFKVDPKNAPHFEALKADPVFAEIAKQAHEDGVPQIAMANMYQKALNAMSEAGLLEPPIDLVAEKAALVPDAAKSLPPAEQELAVQKRLNENYAFLDLMVQNRGMPKDVAQHLELSLGDSAKGHTAIEWFKAQLQQGGSAAGAHGSGGGAVTAESIRTEQARIDALPIGSPERKSADAALDEQRKRLHGS